MSRREFVMLHPAGGRIYFYPATKNFVHVDCDDRGNEFAMRFSKNIGELLIGRKSDE